MECHKGFELEIRVVFKSRWLTKDRFLLARQNGEMIHFDLRIFCKKEGKNDQLYKKFFSDFKMFQVGK